MTDRNTIRQSLGIALFAALMAAGAFIRVPVGPVPITLTTLFLVLAGLILGSGGGSATVLVYLAMGAAGLPVFAGGGGPAVFAGPTGGFLIAYIPAAAVAGLCAEAAAGKDRGRIFWYIAGAAAATIIIYAGGVPWLKYRLAMNWPKAFAAGMLPFLPGDGLKAAAAVSIAAALRKRTPEILPELSGLLSKKK